MGCTRQDNAGTSAPQGADAAAAVESMFGVKVEAVTTSNVKGKKKVFKGKVGQRINWKKAVVKVSEGQMIDATAS